jgi:tRNA U55 pseudouridine synthase TruB
VRTLAEDISVALGTCGHLVELRRVASGAFNVDDGVTIDQLRQREEVLNNLKSLSDAVPMVPELVVGKDAARRIANGVSLQAGWVENSISAGIRPDDTASEVVKVVDSEGTLLSLVKSEGRLGEINSLPPDCVVGKSLRVFNLV